MPASGAVKGSSDASNSSSGSAQTQKQDQSGLGSSQSRSDGNARSKKDCPKHRSQSGGSLSGSSYQGPSGTPQTQSQ